MARYSKDQEPIPGYRLKSFLGKGGFGEVWKSTAPGGIYAALKFISLSGAPGKREFAALSLMKTIRQPNLVPIFASWFLDDRGNILSDGRSDPRDSLLAGTLPHIPVGAPRAPEVDYDAAKDASELVIAMGLGDKSLADRLEECKAEGNFGIPTEELLDYLDGAARAIDFLNRPTHDLGYGPVAIQHCDIKPLNLLVVGDSCQVCDFGLARALDSQNFRVTQASCSPAYGAPESLQGRTPCETTDQYSLGITYVELRTGFLPFESANLGVVINAHLSGKLDLSRLSEPEAEIIRKATHLDPKQRYPTCSAMMKALRRCLDPPSRPRVPSDEILPPKPTGVLPGYRTIRRLPMDFVSDFTECEDPSGKTVAVLVRELSSGGSEIDFPAYRRLAEADYPGLQKLHRACLLNETGELIGDLSRNPAPHHVPAKLAMVYDCAPKSLLNRLKECRRETMRGIPIDELIGRMRRLAAALDYLNSPIHEHNGVRYRIVHGNLSPESIRLVDGETLLGNFASARLLEGDRPLIVSPLTAFEHPYTSPDLLRNSLTPTSDQSSLALLYTHLRTGESPFDASVSISNLRANKAENALGLLELEAEERAVVVRALNSAWRERYPSCLDFVDELAAAIERQLRAAEAAKRTKSGSTVIEPPPQLPTAIPVPETPEEIPQLKAPPTKTGSGEVPPAVVDTPHDTITTPQVEARAAEPELSDPNKTQILRGSTVDLPIAPPPEQELKTPSSVVADDDGSRSAIEGTMLPGSLPKFETEDEPVAPLPPEPVAPLEPPVLAPPQPAAPPPAPPPPAPPPAVPEPVKPPKPEPKIVARPPQPNVAAPTKSSSFGLIGLAAAAVAVTIVAFIALLPRQTSVVVPDPPPVDPTPTLTRPIATSSATPITTPTVTPTPTPSATAKVTPPPPPPPPPMPAVYTFRVLPAETEVAVVGGDAVIAKAGALHTLTVAKPDGRTNIELVGKAVGYEPGLLSVRAQPGETKSLTDLRLVPKPATYTVAVAPAEATLSITGGRAKVTSSAGERTITFDPPDLPQTGEMTIAMPGYESLVRKLSVRPGEAARLDDVKLEPLPAEYVLDVSPPTALVMASLGELTDKKLRVLKPDGRTTITVTAKRSNHKDALISFTPMPGERRSISLKLEALPLEKSFLNDLKMRLVLIPAGTFQMGAPAADTDAESDEKPQHAVKISNPFYLGAYEVTRDEFAQFVAAENYQTDAERDGKGGWGYNETTNKFDHEPLYNWRNVGSKQLGNQPVVNVSWNDAQAFCRWLSKRENRNYRLPTEAEWEYAARAGTTTKYVHGNDPEGLAAIGNVADGTFKGRSPGGSSHGIDSSDGFVFTAPVGKFAPNAFGLFDTTGNVWEWCGDWYGADIYRGAATADPTGPPQGTRRVMRGGSWNDAPASCRSTDRNWSTPTHRDDYLGFRVVLEP